MPLILNSFIILLLLASPFSFASRFECGTIEIKKTVNKKVEITQALACTNSKRNVLISQNCKDKKCKALDFDPYAISKKDLSGQMGKPGFKLCRKILGSPSLVEFKIKKKWYALDECRIDSDNSFVSTGELMEKFYKSRREK